MLSYSYTALVVRGVHFAPSRYPFFHCFFTCQWVPLRILLRLFQALLQEARGFQALTQAEWKVRWNALMVGFKNEYNLFFNRYICLTALQAPLKSKLVSLQWLQIKRSTGSSKAYWQATLHDTTIYSSRYFTRVLHLTALDTGRYFMRCTRYAD
jgi:hypothetical protein